MTRALTQVWLRLRGLVSSDQGQTTVEYAIIVCWGVIVVIAALAALEAAVYNYYYDVVSLICLPIP